MNKQKNKCNYWIGITLIIILILISTFLIYSKMPKRYCHTEISVEKIETSLFSDVSYRDFPYDAEIICEDKNVVVDKYDGLKVQKIWDYNDYKSICLVKIYEKVCEIK